LAAAKAAIMVALRLEDDNFTLDPVFLELFVATFQSQELREWASTISAASQERPSLSSGQLGHSEAIAPVLPVEVLPSVEVVSSVGVPPSVEFLVPAVPSLEVPHVEVPPSVEVLAMEVSFVGVSQSTESVSEVASGADKASKDSGSAALENFVKSITKDILSPLLDKPPPYRQVDHVLRDAPPQLPSSEAFGLSEAIAKPWTLSQLSNRQSGVSMRLARLCL
jgi:hypothetical protein